MIAWLLGRSITKFERENGYDAAYLREVLNASPEALLRFSSVGIMSNYRRDVPLDVYYAAKITAAMRADCGPCTQLVAGFAEREGVDQGVLRALVRGDLGQLPESVRLSASYANAVLSRSMEIDEIRAELAALFGARGVISLSFAIMSAQLYPTLKYALGHGKACVAVEIGGVEVHRREQGEVNEDWGASFGLET